jgi:hypothetical protein
MVVGGVGGRLEIPVDRIDDLQLAVTTLLGRMESDATAVIELDTDDHGVTCRVGPIGTWLSAVMPTVEKLVSWATSGTHEGETFVTMRLDALASVNAGN